MEGPGDEERQKPGVVAPEHAMGECPPRLLEEGQESVVCTSTWTPPNTNVGITKSDFHDEILQKEL